MKTPPAASCVLSFLAAFWGFAFVSPLSAQVSYTYTAPPPPGYPAAGTAAKQTSTRSTRQAAAAVQAPATYPNTYPPPPGYTYPPPPGYGAAPVPKTPAKPAAGKPATKSSASKKPVTGPPPPPSGSKVYGPTGDLSTQVSRIRESDKVQNLRLGELERDVSSIKRSGKGGSRYDGGTDLAAHTTYVARPGDTLFRIASTHRVSVGEIQQLNRMTEEEVRVGQTLLIPSPHRLSSPTTQVSYRPSAPGGSSTSAPVSSSVYYTVKKGDSLKGIAIKHKMTTATLATANSIKDANKIFVGQRLKIPGRSVASAPKPAPAPAPHSESSDTVPLPGYGVPAAPPPAAGLAEVPPPTPASAAPAAPKAPNMNDAHRGILAYRVDGSDTIESIAHQFSTTPEKIRDMNRMDAGMKLKNGDEIMVPAMGAVSVAR